MKIRIHFKNGIERTYEDVRLTTVYPHPDAHGSPPLFVMHFWRDATPAEFIELEQVASIVTSARGTILGELDPRQRRTGG